jgi:integrase
LNAESQEILQRRLELGYEFVFTGRAGNQPNYKSWFRRLLIRTGVKKKYNGFHSLRHTFATRLRRNGADIADIEELFGSTDISTTLIHANYNDKNLRNIVESLVK